MEDWYFGASRSDSARLDVDHLAIMQHRRLHALRNMSDKQYLQMRGGRCVQWPEELKNTEIGGIRRSPRGYKIYETRERLRELQSRLAHVVEAFPQRAGFAVDQDYFGLRSYGGQFPWARFASYISLDKRLRAYKALREIERWREKRRREEREEERRAKAYPELLGRIRELEARLAEGKSE
jgi:hypothetical protein